ncbi:MAG: alpha/beta fold hydrolase [Candidatus Limnocylindria bacterium]
MRRVALDNPERVAGLVLEASPATLRGDTGLEGFVASVVSGLEDPTDPAFLRSFVVDTSSQGVAADVIEELVGELLTVPARVWREMFAGLLAYDDTAELERITAPTLLVWGDADGLVGRDAQEMLAGRLHNAELVVYPGVGHTPRWEDPGRFAADVVTFVERLEAM